VKNIARPVRIFEIRPFGAEPAPAASPLSRLLGALAGIFTRR